MRFISFVFLVLFAGVVGIFAYQNQNDITLRFLDYDITASVAMVMSVTFLLGMLSGWSIIGMVRRSFYRVTHEDPASGRYAYR